MGRVREISRAVKAHDSCLYAQETKPGRIDIYRKSQFGCQPPNFIFSLTDDWSPKGRPVPYGSEVVLNRLKALDLWRDDTFVERWIEDHEKIEKSKERSFHNTIESFLYDFRSQFHKATSDINTAGMKKIHRKERDYGSRQ